MSQDTEYVIELRDQFTMGFLEGLEAAGVVGTGELIREIKFHGAVAIWIE